MTHKLIVIMIDGLGADYFAKYRHRLPFINALAERGTLVERLSPERCGTSLPGRTSIVTGVSSAEHGIFGNTIWDDGNGANTKGFRHANWEDIKTTTVAEQATKTGLTVANIGFGMLNPSHSELYYPPTWTHEMLHTKVDNVDQEDENSKKNKDNEEKPSNADQNWLDQAELSNNATWLDDLVKKGYPKKLVERDYAEPMEYLISGQMNDQIMADWTSGLAAHRSGIDFIITEFAMPDYFLHRYGCEHDLTRMAIETADAQVGRIITALERENRLQDYNIMITSDHGFTDIKYSIHPEHILKNDENDIHFSCEGGILHLHYENETQLSNYTEQLAEHDVIPFCNDYLPASIRSNIATFLAPEECDFYLDKHHCRLAIGPSNYKANHGFKEGHSADERFLVMAGPNIQKRIIGRGLAEQVAPTIAKILGLNQDCYPKASMI